MKIIKVTPENMDMFNKELKTPNIIAFVKIYSDGCGHCKNLEPKWDKLENEMKNENMEGLLASLSVNDLDDADCDTNTRGVPTLRVYQGGRRIMDYEGKRETKDMKMFFKNLLKTKKGGKRKTKKGRRKKRKNTRRNKKRRNKKRRKRGGQICFTKKCKRNRERRKTDKLNKQFLEDEENLKYNLAWEVCYDKNSNKADYDKCVNKIVGNSPLNEDAELMDQVTNILNQKKEDKVMKLAPAPGMHRKSIGGRKTRKKRSRKTNSRKRRQTRKKRKSRKR